MIGKASLSASAMSELTDGWLLELDEVAVTFLAGGTIIGPGGINAAISDTLSIRGALAENFDVMFNCNNSGSPDIVCFLFRCEKLACRY